MTDPRLDPDDSEWDDDIDDDSDGPDEAPIDGWACDMAAERDAAFTRGDDRD